MLPQFEKEDVDHLLQCVTGNGGHHLEVLEMLQVLVVVVDTKNDVL